MDGELTCDEPTGKRRRPNREVEANGTIAEPSMSAELKEFVRREALAIIRDHVPKVKYTIVAHPSMAHIKDALIQLDSSTYDEVNVKWGEFESGMPNIFIEEVHRLPPAHVLLLLNMRKKEILLDEISLLYAIPRYGCRSLTVLMPFYPTGTMERVDKEGEVATAATLSRMLSATPVTPGGPARFLIFDIHALQIRFYFQDNCLPVLLSAMPLLKNMLQERYSHERIAIAFPDEGAKKRFGGFFEKAGYPVLFCSKVREGDQRVVRIAEGEPQGKHVFIVDDLCNTCGTVLACQKVLKESGASKVSVFVTHGVFPLDSWKKFENAGFERIFITDSIPETYEVFKDHCAKHGDKSPFEMISLAPGLHAYLNGQENYAARSAWR